MALKTVAERVIREGLKKKQSEKLAFDQKARGGGGFGENKIANFIFSFSQNSEYSFQVT